MTIRAIVFDLDGTLIDSRADIAAAANHALTRHGYATQSVETISQFVGDGAHLLLARAARLAPDAPELAPLYEAFITYYSAHPADATTLCRGAREALDGRLGVPLGLCTNKPRPTTERVLAALRLDDRFDAVVAGGDVHPNKPDPAPIRLAAQLLGVAPAELAMVGDGAQDVLAGRSAGALTVGVRGGIQAEERLLSAAPDLIIDSLEELPAALDRWRQS